MIAAAAINARETAVDTWARAPERGQARAADQIRRMVGGGLWDRRATGVSATRRRSERSHRLEAVTDVAGGAIVEPLLMTAISFRAAPAWQHGVAAAESPIVQHS